MSKKDSPENVDIDRRRFIRKAAYSAPTIVAMGMLSDPRKAKAANCFPGDPGCNELPPSGPNVFHEGPTEGAEANKEEIA